MSYPPLNVRMDASFCGPSGSRCSLFVAWWPEIFHTLKTWEQPGKQTSTSSSEGPTYKQTSEIQRSFRSKIQNWGTWDLASGPAARAASSHRPHKALCSRRPSQSLKSDGVKPKSITAQLAGGKQKVSSQEIKKQKVKNIRVQENFVSKHITRAPRRNWSTCWCRP